MTLVADDADLIRSITEGDTQSLSVLYERYFDQVYDLAMRTVRNSEVAADVVQNTFLKAWEALVKGQTPVNLKAWLFTIARNLAIDEMRRKKHFAEYQPASTDSDAEPDVFEQIDQDRFADPARALEDKEMVSLVWQCAASLNPKDYSLLDLHLRQGLSADELAESLEVSKGSMYTRLSRLRDALTEAVSFRLLALRGRNNCKELELVTGSSLSLKLSPTTQRAMRKHLKKCGVCQTNLLRFTAPSEMFAGLAPVPALPFVRESVWRGLAARMSVTHGRSSNHRNSLRNAGIAVVVAALLLLLLYAFAGATSHSRPNLAAAVVPDPEDAHSASHQIGVATTDNVITITWTPRKDATGYSVNWASTDQELPDTVPDLEASATQTSSPPLEPGSWYFHLRTRSPNGSWTSTVHLGPFIIQALPVPDVMPEEPPPAEIPVDPATGGPPEPAPGNLPADQPRPTAPTPTRQLVPPTPTAVPARREDAPPTQVVPAAMPTATQQPVFIPPTLTPVPTIVFIERPPTATPTRSPPPPPTVVIPPTRIPTVAAPCSVPGVSCPPTATRITGTGPAS